MKSNLHNKFINEMNSKVVKDISCAKGFFRTNWYNARAISGISLTTSEISYKRTDGKNVDSV
jgi:hypothetical protein